MIVTDILKIVSNVCDQLPDRRSRNIWSPWWLGRWGHYIDFLIRTWAAAQLVFVDKEEGLKGMAFSIVFPFFLKIHEKEMLFLISPDFDNLHLVLFFHSLFLPSGKSTCRIAESQRLSGRSPRSCFSCLSLEGPKKEVLSMSKAAVQTHTKNTKNMSEPIINPEYPRGITKIRTWQPSIVWNETYLNRTNITWTTTIQFSTNFSQKRSQKGSNHPRPEQRTRDSSRKRPPKWRTRRWWCQPCPANTSSPSVGVKVHWATRGPVGHPNGDAWPCGRRTAPCFGH